MRQITEVKPKQSLFNMPDWHHHHSIKINIVSFDSLNPKAKSLILGSNAVRIVVHRDLNLIEWAIDYEIMHNGGSWSKGYIWMSKGDLRIAFGLSNKCQKEYGQEILNKYGGEVAHVGKYIRFGEYLNIPGPGTGYDGDPNVSIWADDEIRKSIALLIK